MYAGEDILTDDTLIEHDSVLIVVTFPRHISYKEVLTQSQLAVLRAVTLGEDVAELDALSLLADGSQVDGHVLVRAAELRDAVFLQSRLEAYELLVLSAVVEDADSS